MLVPDALSPLETNNNPYTDGEDGPTQTSDGTPTSIQMNNTMQKKRMRGHPLADKLRLGWALSINDTYNKLNTILQSSCDVASSWLQAGRQHERSLIHPKSRPWLGHVSSDDFAWWDDDRFSSSRDRCHRLPANAPMLGPAYAIRQPLLVILGQLRTTELEYPINEPLLARQSRNARTVLCFVTGGANVVDTGIVQCGVGDKGWFGGGEKGWRGT
jgi:hypothetical protein